MEILVVEDNLADGRLTSELLKSGRAGNNLRVARDGVEAMAYLRREGEFAWATRPDLILLDLHLPKKDGREVLAEIKGDADFKTIPVIVMTMSAEEEDILAAYFLHANCFITKPVDLQEFKKVLRSIEEFWLATVKLPPRK